MSEINDPGTVPTSGYNAALAAVGMRDAAWSAVRERQRAADLPGLILAQMALELIDAAAQRREHDSFLRTRAEAFEADDPPIPALTSVG